MTKTGLANKELEVRKGIKAAELRHDELQQEKNRQAKLAGDTIQAVGRVTSSAVGGLTKLGKAGKAVASAGKSWGNLVKWRNHPDWYKRLPELVNPNVSLPTIITNGKEPDGIRAGGPELGVLYYAPSYANTETSDQKKIPLTDTALNMAAARLMTHLRSYNSRIAEYEPGDLMQVILGQLSIFEFVTYVGRIVQCATKFEYYNPGLRDRFLKAMGFSPMVIQAQLPTLRKLYVTMLEQVNMTLTVPADMSLCARRLMLNSKIYKEGAGDNSQYVLAQPIGFYEYDELSASLKFKKLLTSSTLLVTSDLEAKYYSMMSKIQNSTVLNTMIADIKTAEERGLNTLKLDNIVDVPMEWAEIDEVLTQFMNATLPKFTTNLVNQNLAYVTEEPETAGATAVASAIASNAYNSPLCEFISTDYGIPDILQDTNGFLYPYNYADPAEVNGGGVSITDYESYSASDFNEAIANKSLNAPSEVLNFYKNDVTSDDILVATRLTTKWTSKVIEVYSGGNLVAYKHAEVAITAGTEVVLCFSVVQDASYYIFDGACGGSGISGTGSRLRAFKYHPIVRCVQFNGSSAGSYESGDPLWYPADQTTYRQGIGPDYYKIMLIKEDELYWIHNMCFQSELFIPKVS